MSEKNDIGYGSEIYREKMSINARKRNRQHNPALACEDHSAQPISAQTHTAEIASSNNPTEPSFDPAKPQQSSKSSCAVS